MESSQHSGWIYAVTAGEFTKVGSSSHPSRRAMAFVHREMLAGLVYLQAVRVQGHRFPIEHLVHRTLLDRRVHGEQVEGDVSDLPSLVREAEGVVAEIRREYRPGNVHALAKRLGLSIAFVAKVGGGL